MVVQNTTGILGFTSSRQSWFLCILPFCGAARRPCRPSFRHLPVHDTSTLQLTRACKELLLFVLAAANCIQHGAQLERATGQRC
jgi:hypothetical protein